ncbi:MAG: hypothetical protein Q8N04_03135 [Nitrospira sp.]|nr:hypothetical protein [Nitrospira sp.]
MKAVQRLPLHPAHDLVFHVADELLVHHALEPAQHLVALVRRVDAIADPDQPHTPMDKAAARLLRFHAVAAQPTEIIDQQNVELLRLRVFQHLLVLRAFGRRAADRSIRIPRRDRPPLTCRSRFAIAELVRDGTFFLVLG